MSGGDMQAPQDKTSRTSESLNADSYDNHTNQSQSGSAERLLERSVKQIQIKEVSTVEKVIKTREVKHVSPTGEQTTSFAREESGSVTQLKTQDQNRGQNLVENSQHELRQEHNQGVQYFPVADSLQAQATTDDQFNVLSSSSHAAHTLNSNAYTKISDMDFAQNQGYGDQPFDPYGLLQPIGYLQANTDQRQTYDSSPQTTLYGQTPAHAHPQSQAQIHPIYGHSINDVQSIYATRDAASGLPGQTILIGPYNVAQQHVQQDVRWRDPDLNEVIQFLTNPNAIIRANAAAYLQHLSYMDDGIKQQTRLLGGIPILVSLIERDPNLEVQKNACGALRNLSYGRQNDDNKVAIKASGGITALVKLLLLTTQATIDQQSMQQQQQNIKNDEMREQITGVLWNLSSCEELKWSIIDEALETIVARIIVPKKEWCKLNNCTTGTISMTQSIASGTAAAHIPSASETYWSTVFRNATGILRNVSSAGAYARKQLRECDGLVESLLTIIRIAISKNDVENKLVENCVCILRNLSYRCQEIQDPNYDQQNSPYKTTLNSSDQEQQQSSSPINLASSFVGQISSKVGDNLGCFSGMISGRSGASLTSSGSSKSKWKSKSSTNEHNNNDQKLNAIMPPHHHHNLTQSQLENNNTKSSTLMRTSTHLGHFDQVNSSANSATLPRHFSSMNNTSFISTGTTGSKQELLWQPDVVKPYLSLLSECSNSETLEAAAGAIQNLSACYWQPSVDIRATVRKEKGLPVLVELLRMDRDRVVCAVATALRNLAIDQRNKELIGKYAMHDLISKLPNGDAQHDSSASDETVAAVLATLNEVISKNSDFARSLFEAGGIERLNYTIKNRAKYSVRVQRFTAQVLQNMWNFVELRELYKKAGWKETNFLVRNHILNKASTYSIYSTNTIDRPMSSQQPDPANTSLKSNKNSNGTPTASARRTVSSGTLDATDGRILQANHMQIQQQHSPYGTMNMMPVAAHSSDPSVVAPVYAQVNRDKKR